MEKKIKKLKKWNTSYELLFITRITSYFLTMSYNKDKDDKFVLRW